MGLRRDTFEHLEKIAVFAARLGAATLSFAHLMPTSEGHQNDLALTLDERRWAEEEIALLSKIFKMKISVDVGYYNIDLAPPCSPLAGTNYNIDYRGRLTLCCNLSGFRGGENGADFVADLNAESFGAALDRFNQLKDIQLERRRAALTESRERGITPDIYLGSPCLFCLNSFHKLPWRSQPVSISSPEHALPVLGNYAAELPTPVLTKVGRCDD